MTNREIENKKNELIRIVNMSSGTENQRMKELRKLALDVGASHKTVDGNRNANEAELVVGIQTALQTALMLNSCKSSTMAWIIAIISVGIALISTLVSGLSAVAAWVAVFVNE